MRSSQVGCFLSSFGFDDQIIHNTSVKENVPHKKRVHLKNKMSCLVLARSSTKTDPLPESIPLPSCEAYVAAIAAAVDAFKKRSDSTDDRGGEKDDDHSDEARVASHPVDCQIVKVTVIEKGDRRGGAYIDFNSQAAAELAAKACNNVATLSNLEWWSAKPLAVTVKAQNLPKVFATNVASSTSGGGGGGAAALSASNGTGGKQQQQQQQPQQSAAAKAPTLFVRCRSFTRIHHVFDFFRDNNVTGHADDCVFVDGSKKPYFLLEWGKNKGSYDASLALDGSVVGGGNDVHIKPSTLSAAEYKTKNPTALSLATKRESGQVRQRNESDDGGGGGGVGEQRPQTREEKAEVAVAAFVPISLLMNKKK